MIFKNLFFFPDADIKVFKHEEIFGKYSSIFSKVPDDVKTKFIKTLESKVKLYAASLKLCKCIV